MKNKFRCQCGYSFCNAECLVVQEIENQLHERHQREIILNIIKSSGSVIAAPFSEISRKESVVLLRRVQRLMRIAVSVGVIEAPSICLGKFICDVKCFEGEKCLLDALEWLKSLYARLEACPIEQLQKVFFYYATLSKAEQELKQALCSNAMACIGQE